MFKIVYVLPLMAPYAIPRYKELAAMDGVEVHVIIEKDTHEERKGWKYQEIEGVHTYLLQSTMTNDFVQKNKGDGYAISNTRMFSRDLKKTIERIHPDVVLVCNSTQIMMLLGRREYKLGVVVEDTLRAAESRSQINKIVKRLMLKQADFYLPFSDDAIDFLHSNGIKAPFIRSYWSMDLPFFQDMTDEKKKLEKRRISEKKIYTIVANLIPRKGVKQFISAWEKMPESFQNEAELFVIGDGELKNDIKKMCEHISNVHILGNKPYAEVSHFLQCSDVFILPTLEDLCSLAVLEAMAAGCPVLTTIYNGARQFVKEGVNGFIFDPTSEASIKEVLNKISTSDIKKMSAASLGLVQEYSTEKVMRKLGTDLIDFCQG